MPNTRIFLFHNDVPEGRIFDLTDTEMNELANDGWVDSPCKLDSHQESHLGVTIEQAQDANPHDLVKLVESLGFKVFTEDAFQAEINKAVSALNNEFVTREVSLQGQPDNEDTSLDSFTDQQIIAEGERRGIASHAPKTLNSEDQCGLGNEAVTGELDIIEELLNQFNEDPESLNIPELVQLGNTKYTLGLRSNMRESTLIDKITTAMLEAE